MKQFKALSAMVLALAMAVVLAACGGGTSSSSSAGSSSADGASASQDASASSEASGELLGKPWVTSILQGNLPAQQPEAKDDLYTHYAYDYLSAHQEQPSSAMEDYAPELVATCLSAIKDSSKSGHDLDQLRIFFNQAADAETLQKTGMADVQPYLDRIDAVSSIEENYSGKYSTQDFGAAAQAAREGYISLDDLCASCPNFPMKAVLDKLGKGNSPLYSSAPGWTAALDEVWKDENIDVIKEIAALKVLNETRPYRDPSVLNQMLEQSGDVVDDADTFAYKACDSMDTLAVVLANTYVSEALGANAKERLTNLSQDLVSAYKDLVDETAWVGEESRAHSSTPTARPTPCLQTPTWTRTC
ncbi:MAG: hypothetical protein IJ111_06490 [Eggerthellaceae bacterium]|nr:hypothetical protein [Eggerthellaceae bacterium]